MHHRRLLFWVTALCSLSIVQPGWTADAPPRAVGDSVTGKALAGPMRDVQHIVFAVRLGYEDPHWYANIGYFCDDEKSKAYAGNGKPDVGRLCKLDLRTGEVSVLLDAEGGSIRDPEVHYDAQNVSSFPTAKQTPDFYHLYEINVDGSGLRQLTVGDFDDFEPTYLPDGGHRVCLHPLPTLGQLLDDAGGRAVPLRRRRRQHPAALAQRRTRQHALGAARRPHSLHALGVRRPQPGRVSPPVDDEPGRQRADGLLSATCIPAS